MATGPFVKQRCAESEPESRTCEQSVARRTRAPLYRMRQLAMEHRLKWNTTCNGTQLEMEHSLQWNTTLQLFFDTELTGALQPPMASVTQHRWCGRILYMEHPSVAALPAVNLMHASQRCSTASFTS